MSVNLVSNVARVLSDFQVETHCWLDSTVALFWIRGKGEYRQFVANRVQKIQQHDKVVWHHVPTSQNPADLGSRGGSVAKNHLWREGPTWLSNRSEWPADVALEATAETRAEAKVKREILAVTSVESDEFDQLLDKYDLFKQRYDNGKNTRTSLGPATASVGQENKIKVPRLQKISNKSVSNTTTRETSEQQNPRDSALSSVGSRLCGSN